MAVGDEVQAQPCTCLDRKMVREYLGNDDIFLAKHVKSDLYQPDRDQDGQVIGDRTVDDLFIKGRWGLVCRHLRWVLVIKHRFHPSFKFKLIDDRRLVDVYVGGEAYKNKAVSSREDHEINNSLSDLVSAPDLLLIKLGVLTTNNKAAASTVLQALTIRSAIGKPVWLLEADKAFGAGHKSYSYELGDHIEDHYEVVDLREDISVPLFAAPATSLEVESVVMGAEEAPPRAEEFEEEPVSEERFKSTFKKGKKARSSLPDMS